MTDSESTSTTTTTNTNETQAAKNSKLRWSLYWLLIILSAGTMVGRIIAVDNGNGWPFLSANDRSRWAAIRALGDFGTFEIDEVIKEKKWDSIDKVMHDGHSYSSKPPLFPVMLTGKYLLLKKLTGMSLGTHPHAIGRIMLVWVNVIPMMLMFYLLARILEDSGTTTFGRLFVMGCATFGTFLTTFSVTLNNHLPAAISLMIALWAAIPILTSKDQSWWRFVLAGLFAAFTAANELPALSFMGLLGLAMLWKAPARTLLIGLPAVAIVLGAFFATNHIAHDSLRPPYMHRTQPDDDWYDYPNSYWSNRQGIDQGELDKSTYALHTTVGHHGVFSLTPIWILSFLGMGLLIFQPKHNLNLVAWQTLILTVVCWVFYVYFRPLEDRNYGGMTCGLRWMFWLIPMWLVTLIPVADYCAKVPVLKKLALGLLLISIISATYAADNPWTHPWIYDLMYHEQLLPK